MDDAQLLLFRWGTEEYGVSTAKVAAVTGKVWINRPPLPAVDEDDLGGLTKNIPIVCQDGDNQRMIIMHANGIQIALIVDEVTGVVSQNAAAAATAATFKIWRIRGGTISPDD